MFPDPPLVGGLLSCDPPPDPPGAYGEGPAPPPPADLMKFTLG